MPTFNSNIPQPGDFLSDSQVDLLNNNKALDAVYDRNHYKFSNNVSVTQGKHKFVEMMNQGGVPAPTNGLANLSGTVYTKTVGGTGTSDLFYTNDDNQVREYQLTNVVSNANAATAFPLLATNGAITNGVGGWTWLGQGIILQYGYVNYPPGGNITFPVPFTSNPFNIQITPVGTGSTSGSIKFRVESGTVDTIKFALSTSTDGSGFGITNLYWMAIGPY